MKPRLIVFSLALASILFGCQSRFVESSPNSVKTKGIPLEERLVQKSKVDSKIDEIQRGAEKAKRIVELFKKVQSPNSHEDVYTPIDFLLDVNHELKQKIPENGDGGLFRQGKIILPLDQLSENCRTIETLLQSDVVYDEVVTDKVIGERLVYSVKTCGSNEYLPAVEANWYGLNLEFSLINKNLETVFKNILFTEGLKNSVCKIKQGEKNILDSIYCENLEVRLSKSEHALIKSMGFNNRGEVRFETFADIFENNKKKASSETQVLSNGKVQFEVKPAGEKPSTENP